MMRLKKRKLHRDRLLIRKGNEQWQEKERISHWMKELRRQKQLYFRRRTDRYDAAVKGLSILQKKKQELQKQELLHAIETSPRSYEEIMAFLSGKKDPDEE